MQVTTTEISLWTGLEFDRVLFDSNPLKFYSGPEAITVKKRNDRVIDGVDQSEFFLGKQKRSNRDGVIIYQGAKINGVKWKNWKVLFNELDSIFSPTLAYDTPKIYNLMADPGERLNVLFPNTWVAQKALPQLTEHANSLQKEPPIKPGTPDPYKPPK